MRILGINLGINESVGTGIAQIEESKVRTFSVYKDKEIEEIIEKYRPDLIVINSPLHMTDKPYRSAEKEMEAVGYNPEPQNMEHQKELAKRGNMFRVNYQTDYEIIESHVESAKKALKMTEPRELNKIRVLNIVKNQMEKDAIFTAVTGIFYKEGAFEEFGDDEEGKIIVPKIE